MGCESNREATINWVSLAIKVPTMLNSGNFSPAVASNQLPGPFCTATSRIGRHSVNGTCAQVVNDLSGRYCQSVI
jgi:hypothetical protein